MSSNFPFDAFKRDPQMDRRILDSNYPSDFFPKKGEYFRVRAATIADRSYMGDIWLCMEAQDFCAVGKRVLDTYNGLESKQLGQLKSFVAGDMIFYDCTKIWAAVEEDRGAPKIQPTTRRATGKAIAAAVYMPAVLTRAAGRESEMRRSPDRTGERQ